MVGATSFGKRGSVCGQSGCGSKFAWQRKQDKPVFGDGQREAKNALGGNQLVASVESRLSAKKYIFRLPDWNCFFKM